MGSSLTTEQILQAVEIERKYPTLMITAGYDHTIRFWEALSGICSRTIQHPDSQVNRLCIAPDKRWLAAAGKDSVKLFDIRSTNPNAVMTFKGHTDNITGVAFHCESKWMVTSSEDGTVKIWDIRDGKVQRNYEHGSPVNDVVIHPNQGELIACDRAGSIRIWDLGKNCCAHELQPNAGVSMQSVTVATDGTLMAAGDNSVCIPGPHLICLFPSLSEHPYPSIRFRLTLCQGQVHLWRLEPEGHENENTRVTPIMTFRAHNSYILRVLLSPDVRHLATCSADHNARIWEVEVDPKALDDEKYQRAKLERLPPDLRNADPEHTGGTGGSHGPSTAAETPDGAGTEAQEAAARKKSRDLLLLEANLGAHQRWVWDCAFSADSAYLVTASSDHYARLWELASSTIIRQYNGHHRGCTTVALNDYSEAR